MKERKGLVTMMGSPVTLVGEEVREGEPAPGFKALDVNLSEKGLVDFKGKVVVLASVPSLDTPVCNLEAQRFNREASGLGDEVAILIISMDLPFAQKRWCGAHGVDKVVTLSDHRDADFGLSYGVLIKEARLLARAVFVVDREGVLRYQELVKEVAEEPDYEAALEAVKSLV